MKEKLQYATGSEAMKVYIEQSGTIPPHLVKTVTMPAFSKINASLNDELDLAFTSGQDPKTTAQNIDAATRAALG